MRDVDVVADQLIIGWYAMTALEAMCYEKPVYVISNLVYRHCMKKVGCLTLMSYRLCNAITIM